MPAGPILRGLNVVRSESGRYWDSALWIVKRRGRRTKILVAFILGYFNDHAPYQQDCKNTLPDKGVP
jgi:hypothetical protein